MRTLICLAFLPFIFSCSSNENSSVTTTTSVQTNTETVNSVIGKNGKYIVDNNTAGYIHRLENIVENFRVMARKRKPGIDIYNEFAVLLSREVETVGTNINITGEGAEKLKSIIAKISEDNKGIAGNDLEKARSAFQNVCELTNEIRSGFDYNN